MSKLTMPTTKKLMEKNSTEQVDPLDELDLKDPEQLDEYIKAMEARWEEIKKK